MTKQAKKQRPMVEDRVIAEHLTALLTPAITSQSRFFRELGRARENSDTSLNGSCGAEMKIDSTGTSKLHHFLRNTGERDNSAKEYGFRVNNTASINSKVA